MGQDFFFGEQDQFPYDPYNYVPTPGGSPSAPTDDPLRLAAADPMPSAVSTRTRWTRAGSTRAAAWRRSMCRATRSISPGSPTSAGSDFPGSPDGAHPMADDGALFDASAMVPYSPGVPWADESAGGGRSLLRPAVWCCRYVNVVAQYGPRCSRSAVSRSPSPRAAADGASLRKGARSPRRPRHHRAPADDHPPHDRKVERMHHAIRAVCAPQALAARITRELLGARRRR